MVFYIDEAGEGGNPFSLRDCIPDFPLPLHPIPRNRRYSQTGRDRGCGNLTFTNFRAE
jgi:hypothetical protein